MKKQKTFKEYLNAYYADATRKLAIPTSKSGVNVSIKTKNPYFFEDYLKKQIKKDKTFKIKYVVGLKKITSKINKQKTKKCVVESLHINMLHTLRHGTKYFVSDKGRGKTILLSNEIGNAEVIYVKDCKSGTIKYIFNRKNLREFEA